MFDATGEAVAALAVAAPTERLPAESYGDLGDAVTLAAAAPWENSDRTIENNPVLIRLDDHATGGTERPYAGIRLGIDILINKL